MTAADYDWNTKENFLKIQEHDNFKNNWCKIQSITLIRIPYIHLSTLTINDLLENNRFKI